MKYVLLGIFQKQEDADAALFQLGNARFVSDEISVAAREDNLKRYRQKEMERETIITGGLLGGLAGLLLVVTPIVLPGTGILIIGPLTILSGLTLGAVAGGLLGALVDSGLSKNQARSYSRQVEEGGVLLGVQVDGQTGKKARDIMEKHHADEFVLLPYMPTTANTKKSVYTPNYAAAGMKGGKATK